MKNLKGSIMLLITSFIWGTAFVAQSVSTEVIGPLTFNATRSFIGALVLLPIMLIMDKKRPKSWETDTKSLIFGGIVCGVILTLGSALQQIGLIYTPPGKAGFINSLYIIFVPLCAMFTKKRPKPTIWISVALAIVGMYLLCIKESITINKGDIYIFLCAVAYTAHILAIGYFSPKVDGVKLSCIQFLTCGTLSLIYALIFEEPSFAQLDAAIIPLLYTGVLSSGVAYTLQILAQGFTAPTIATLIMSLEAVFSALASWVVLQEVMSTPEIIGSLLMFGGILIAQFV